ncbi:hypothetical protein [Rugosimonospora africana]|uniref:Uncharacterized protein n=1 Tax=Rugosimonospora africana TaxID=556532 RepID=A0A8J3QRT0_9ACTN|nr:hypothetical protein [Rugosimonospora africana]GIH15708.1 hypothetical protein Raf01_38800 [Rugosimonospora africana]
MAVDPSSLTTDQLNAYIVARLTVSGIDLTLLPTTADPVTGAPTQAQALASLRSFVLNNPTAINSWRPVPAAGADADALSQELSPPLEYPSIAQAWTGQVGDR